MERPVTTIALSGVVLATVVFGATRLRKPAAPQPTGPIRYAKIEHVYSGHKVKLDEGEELVYAGIRAPHRGEAGFEAALRRNAELTEGQDVRLRFDIDERNKKGQLEAYVSVSDGMVNELLVREGLAYVRLTPGTSRFSERLLEAQVEARAERIGLWRERRSSRGKRYPADPKYGNFHAVDCEETPKIKAERLVVFKSRDLALEQGYAPCCRCHP